MKFKLICCCVFFRFVATPDPRTRFAGIAGRSSRTSQLSESTLPRKPALRERRMFCSTTEEGVQGCLIKQYEINDVTRIFKTTEYTSHVYLKRHTSRGYQENWLSIEHCSENFKTTENYKRHFNVLTYSNKTKQTASI